MYDYVSLVFRIASLSIYSAFAFLFIFTFPGTNRRLPYRFISWTDLGGFTRSTAAITVRDSCQNKHLKFRYLHIDLRCPLLYASPGAISGFFHLENMSHVTPPDLMTCEGKGSPGLSWELLVGHWVMLE